MAKKQIDKKALNAEISKAMMNDFERIGQGVIDYWKPLAAVVVGVALLVTVICWAAEHQRNSVRKAQEAISEATDVAALTKALETYGDTDAAPTGRYRLALLYLNEKKYAEALNELEQAAGRGDAFLNGNIALTEAYALELSGKPAEAAEKFAVASGEATYPAAMRAEARFAAGRLFVAQKDLARAKSLLEQAPADGVPQGAAAGWDESSAALLRAIESGEYGAISAKPLAQ